MEFELQLCCSIITPQISDSAAGEQVKLVKPRIHDLLKPKPNISPDPKAFTFRVWRIKPQVELYRHEIYSCMEPRLPIKKKSKHLYMEGLTRRFRV